FDAVRINLLYEQARWAVLLEETECTEEEMMVFAALQYHVNKLSVTSDPMEMPRDPALQDLEEALSHLEVKLEANTPSEALVRVTQLSLSATVCTAISHCHGVHGYLSLPRCARLSLTVTATVCTAISHCH
ncbi:hypothetical protein FKM82_030693, partial [Ascaphus truei]